jgi:hypothetical protein
VYWGSGWEEDPELDEDPVEEGMLQYREGWQMWYGKVDVGIDA